MTRWFYTGSRNPAGGFTPGEHRSITFDVMTHVGSIDEVGVGGCDGVDEVVAYAAALAGARVINFRPTNPRAPQRESKAISAICDETVLVDGDELARNLAGIEWADKVRALPLYAFDHRPDGTIHPARGGGTNHTARHAQAAGKLDGWQSLR